MNRQRTGPWQIFHGPIEVVEMGATPTPGPGQGWQGSGHTFTAIARLRSVSEDPAPFFHTPEGYQLTDGRPITWVGIIEGDLEFAMELHNPGGLFLHFPDGTRAHCFVTEMGPGDQPRVARVVSHDDVPASWETTGVPENLPRRV